MEGDKIAFQVYFIICMLFLSIVISTPKALSRPGGEALTKISSPC